MATSNLNPDKVVHLLCREFLERLNLMHAQQQHRRPPLPKAPLQHLAREPEARQRGPAAGLLPGVSLRVCGLTAVQRPLLGLLREEVRLELGRGGCLRRMVRVVVVGGVLAKGRVADQQRLKCHSTGLRCGSMKELGERALMVKKQRNNAWP